MVSKLKNAVGIVVIAAVAGFAGAGIYSGVIENNNHVISSETNQNQPSRLVAFTRDGSIDSPDGFVDASQSTVPAVVHVKTTFTATAGGFNPFQEFFYGDRGYRTPEPSIGTGSGVVITDDGYIVTNNHVVANSDKVEVTLHDKRTLIANVIGTDPSTDLALLKIDDKNLPYIPYGNSDDVKVGEWVLAVGNPFNLTSTVTAGIVSAKARNISILPDQQFPIESFIQTDAAVNPGNSGGALVDTKGFLVGINTAIASRTGSYSGYSFAIPVNIVKKVVDDLIEYGNVQRGFIGVSIRDIDSKLAEEIDIRDMKGVYVAAAMEGGAAQEAGIKEGDIITKVGGVEVNSSPELQEQVSRFRPGDKIEVTINRNNSLRTISVILRNRNGDTKLVKNDVVVSVLGAEFTELTSGEREKLGITNGVKVNKLNTGKLRSAGIREGFIIQSIDNKKIVNTGDIADALNNKKGGVLIEGIYPNGSRAYYGFGL